MPLSNAMAATGALSTVTISRSPPSLRQAVYGEVQTRPLRAWLSFVEKPEVAPTTVTHDACSWRSTALAMASLLAETQHGDQGADALEEALTQLAVLLKSPLAQLQSQAYVLRSALVERHQQDALSGVAHQLLEQADRISDCVATILDVQRMHLGQQPLEKRAVDVVELASTCAFDFHASKQTTSNVRVLADLQPSRWLFADPSRLRQVFVTLLERASERSPCSELDLRIRGDPSSDFPRAIVSVCDADRMFDVVGGKGALASTALRDLDLYQAREVVRLHGGELWAEPRNGGGISGAVIMLPLDGLQS
jgi:signal transduction histidine kinase